MLETVREYALERLDGSGERDELRSRHAEYFLDVARRAEDELRSPKQAEWLRRLEADHDNIRAALVFLLESGRGDEALELVTALRWFWYIHNHLSEGRRWYDAALQATAKKPSRTRAVALNMCGALAAQQGDFDAGRTLFEEALETGRALEEWGRVAGALTNLGNLALFQEDYERAWEMHMEALQLYGRESELHGVAISKENLGLIAMFRGDLAAAITLFEEGEHASREVGDASQTAALLRSHAQAEYERGELDLLAGIVSERGDAERGALLLGAAESLRTGIGAARPPDQRELHARLVESVRSRLGSGFELAFQRGRALPLEVDPARDASELRQARRREVVGDRERERESLLFAVLAEIADAALQSLSRRPAQRRTAIVEHDTAGAGVVEREERAKQLGAT
jgi:non-specific serine/threonine protein kinase